MSNYKGRATISEIMNMPNWLFHGLYSIMVKRLSTEDGQKDKAVETLVEGITEGL